MDSVFEAYLLRGIADQADRAWYSDERRHRFAEPTRKLRARWRAEEQNAHRVASVVHLEGLQAPFFQR